MLGKVRRCAPGANAMTKQLLLKVGQMELEALLDHAADCFTESICGAEGQEGTRAFIDKRLPSWATSADGHAQDATEDNLGGIFEGKPEDKSEDNSEDNAGKNAHE